VVRVADLECSPCLQRVLSARPPPLHGGLAPERVVAAAERLLARA
jgi:hypothetical protein